MALLMESLRTVRRLCMPVAAGRRAFFSSAGGARASGWREHFRDNGFPVWVRRPVRALRVAALATLVYQTGKAAGHTEALEDPETMQTTLIQEILASQHSSSTGALVDVHDAQSAAYRRVKTVGVRCLEAARSFVAAETARLETELVVARSRGDVGKAGELGRGLEELRGAARRLGGEWTWVVTNSEAVNAFVSPYCPRHVFVHEGLLAHLTPTDAELAFLLSHELAHVIHAHAHETMARSAVAAQAQLVVLSLIDPTGLLAFLLTYAFGVWIDAAWVKAHSRHAESEADDSGVKIMHAACYDARAAGSMMAKLGAACVHTRASWLDTHPPPPEREGKLDKAAFSLALEDEHRRCSSVRSLLRSLYAKTRRYQGREQG